MADDWLGKITDGLSSAGKGAAAGAFLGPIGAAAGGAIGLALDLVPDLARTVGRDAGVAQRVVQTVQAVTGATDPGQQHVALADPAVVTDLTVQLAGIVADQEAARDQAQIDVLKASLADVAGARAQTLALAQAGSSIAWGAPVVSVVVAVGFFAALALLIFAPVQMDAGRAAMVNVLVGALGAALTSVLSYWVGSSAGSARKTELLAQQAPTPPSPGVIVPAADVQPSK